jgi:hypothetical protein
MASLAEIRARLQAAESNKSGQPSGDNQIYPHWNMNESTSALVRFLPDGNSKNTFFWVERAMIKMPFNGIRGEADSKQFFVQVPCVEMWGEACPILAEVRPWFKDKSLEDLGRKYWKKRSYVFQGFVRENPIGEDRTPENPIRRFIIGPQIFTIIKAALMDHEITELPTDYAAGLDFRIAKTQKGGYADYNTSKWSRKESSLTAEEAEAIEKHGLFDLGSFLPKKPGEVELKVMKEMFQASVDGQPFDMERWGQYFRPAGMSANSAAVVEAEDYTADAVTGRPSLKVVPSDEPEAPAAEAPVVMPAAGGNKAEDILAMIRARQKQ